MKQGKKAQGISIETVVIALLVLVVVFVSYFIYSEYMKKIGQQTYCNSPNVCDEDCASVGDVNHTYIPLPGYKCNKLGTICCKEIK